MTPEERQAFKQRMKDLKAYREQNPGKGYLDWKVDAYWPGGQTGDDDKNMKRALNISTHILKYQKPLTVDADVIDEYVDKALWTMENPNNKGYNKHDGKYYPYTDSGSDRVVRHNIGPGIEYHSNMARQLKYDGSTGYDKQHLNSLVRDELFKATPKIVESINNMKNGKYYGVWDTLSTGPKMMIYDIYHNVKANNGKNLPEKWPALIESLAKGNLEKAKKETYSGSTRRQQMRNQLATYDEIPYIENRATGGEIGDNDPIRTGTTTYDNYGNATHYLPVSLTDGTLNIGLPEIPVTVANNLNLAESINKGRSAAADIGKEVFANLTPYGDVESAFNAYDAVKNNDWLGFGLASIGMLPLIPNGIRRTSHIVQKARNTKTLHSKLMQQQIEKAMHERNLIQARYNQFMDNAEADKAFVYNSWVNDEDAFRRAVQFDKEYGTNYKKAYSDELRDRAIKIDTEDMPLDKAGKFNPDDPDYITLNHRYAIQGRPDNGLVNHEMGHAIDYRAGVIGDDGKTRIKLFDHKKFKSRDELRKIYKDEKVLDLIFNYRLKDSEIKSHMNQFRTYLRDNDLLDPSGKESLEPFKKKLFDSNFEGVKQIFNSYKRPKLFMKDFNSIPITKVDDNKVIA